MKKAKTMKSVFLCLLALLLALSATACAKGGGETKETGSNGAAVTGGSGNLSGSGTTEEPPAPAAVFPVVKDGKSVRVVYPMDDMSAMDQAYNVANKIKSLTGVAAVCADDSRTLGAEYDRESYEIFVGRVDHPDCEAAYARVPYGGAAVLVEGHKLCVLSTNPSSLNTAVIRLLATMNTKCDKTAKTILLDEDLEILIEGSDLLSMVPQPEGRTPSGTYQSTISASEVIFEDFTEQDVDNYQKTVLAAGYSLYAGDTPAGRKQGTKNRFLTFHNDRYILTVLYTPSDLKMRVIIESQKTSSLGWRESDAPALGEKVCDVTLTQVGLLYDVGSFNGMCYVMRLQDGSFIITDGGHALQKNADRLYEILRKQAPDPDHIVIAAWIFSHAHGDHVGMFPYFTASYASKVTVERFIYNLPGESQIVGDGTAKGNGTILDRVGRYKGAVVTNAHPGQVMTLHGATIRILYTADLFVPTEITYSNTASMCWTVETEGVTTMFMGDIGAEVAAVMESIYADSVLAADVLQIAHHGIGSSPSSLYPRVDPSWTLMPLGTGPLSGWEHADDSIKFVYADHNKFFFTSEKCRDHLFVANDDVLVLTYRNGAVTDSALYDNDAAYLNAEAF